MATIVLFQLVSDSNMVGEHMDLIFSSEQMASDLKMEDMAISPLVQEGL